MKYDFDKVIDRRNTASNKWDIPEGCLGMVTADMDFQAPQPVLDAMEARVKHGIFGYSIRTDSYYDAVTGWMKRRHGWSPEKEWICHTLGVVPAIGFAIAEFTREGDGILIQPPVYHPFAHAIRNSSRKIVKNPLILKDGHYMIDFADLEKKLSDPSVKMMLLCNPQNPTGRVWLPDELARIMELCARYEVLLFSDEIHGDFMMHGSVFTSAGKLNEEAGGKYSSWLILGTAASKTFNLAGLQNADIIIPDAERRQAYKEQLAVYHVFDSSTFGLIAEEAAYRYGEEWLDQLLPYLEGNLDYFEEQIAGRVPGAKVFRNDATYLAWMDCRKWKMTDEELNHFFKERAGIWLNLGSRFGEEAQGFVRINLAVSRSLVEEAVGRIEKTAGEFALSDRL